MRFKNYLNEDITDINKIFELIEKDCKPYLDDFNKLKVKKLLLSGRNETGDFLIKTPRVDRKPLDTPLEIHNFIDNWFYKKFGVKTRSNGVFVTFDHYEAANYGRTYYIFPIGKYDVISSTKVFDMYTEIVCASTRAIMGNWFEPKTQWDDLSKEQKEDIIKTIDRRLNDADYKTGLKFHSKSGGNFNEKMLACKKYYAVKRDVYKYDIEEHFDNV